MRISSLIFVPAALLFVSMTSGQEMLKYDSASEPKAKGIHFSIKYPADWKAIPGERPNIVQNIMSEGGSGLESVCVMVKDIPLPQNAKIEQREIDEFYSKEFLVSLVPKGGEFIKCSETKIDGERSGYICYTSTFEKANIELIYKTESFILFYKNKWVIFNFAVGRKKGEGEGLKLARQFEQVRPIFQQIAASIVLNDKWK